MILLCGSVQHSSLDSAKPIRCYFTVAVSVSHRFYPFKFDASVESHCIEGGVEKSRTVWWVDESSLSILLVLLVHSSILAVLCSARATQVFPRSLAHPAFTSRSATSNTEWPVQGAFTLVPRCCIPTPLFPSSSPHHFHLTSSVDERV